MDSELSLLSNWLCITHWENYRSQTSPTDSTDEPFFASIGRFDIGLRAALASRPLSKHVLVDASSVNFIDTTACDRLLRFIEELRTRGITVAFARVRDEVRERMRLAGIEVLVGSDNFYERLTDGVRAWQRSGSAPSP